MNEFYLSHIIRHRDRHSLSHIPDVVKILKSYHVNRKSIMEIILNLLQERALLLYNQTMMPEVQRTEIL